MIHWYIIVSTLTFFEYDPSPKFDVRYRSVQTMRFSTSSATTIGEEAHFLCDYTGHDWKQERVILYCPNGECGGVVEYCYWCHRKRRKVTKTEWIEEE